MASVDLSSFDFDALKASFRTYLNQQTTFKDYNFDGSSLNQLLNILIASNQIDAFIANMTTNEMWLQTATLRDAVASSSALINYVSRSTVAPVATVSVTSIRTPTDSAPPPYVSIPRGSKFVTQTNDGSYPFVTLDNYIATRIASTDTYVASNVDIYQGKLMSFTYVVSTDEIIPYEIPSDLVDLRTLKVYLKSSFDANDDSRSEYTPAKTIVGLDATSTVYFLEEGTNGKYQIRFGDGIYGVEVPVGWTIQLEYLITQGPAANNARVFSLNAPGVVIRTSSVQTLAPAAGGADRESVDSIKVMAPRHYVAQDRCLAPTDFSALLKTEFPLIRDIAIWGGHDMNPPLFGRSVISIQPEDNYTITPELKRSIIAYLKKKAVVTVTPEIISPDYIYLNPRTRVRFSAKQTTNVESIRSIVYNVFDTWGNANLGMFGASYGNSKVEALIDNSSSLIESNETYVILEKRITPLLVGAHDYILKYNNELAGYLPGQPVLSSSTFVYKGQQCTLQDNDGTVNIIVTTGDNTFTILQGDVGTIDYVNGVVQLTQFYPELSNLGDVRIRCTPKYNDIATTQNFVIDFNLDDLQVNLVQS